MKKKKSLKDLSKVDQLRDKYLPLLKTAGISNPNLEFDLILASTLNITREQAVIAETIDIKKMRILETKLNKRIKRYPIQYLTGKINFMGFEFIVNEECFIPRQETETLVEEAINLKPKTICDVCSGIGSIGISLALYLRNSSIHCSDTNPKALICLSKNLRLHREAISNNRNKVVAIESDLFDKINKDLKFDLIIANPPYISPGDPEVGPETSYEPRNALYADNNGLSAIEKLIPQSKQFLNKNGHLLLEFGYKQSDQVSHLAKSNRYEIVKILIDQEDHKRGILLKLS
ncbi:MAG: peptide chain release factor N(5)-glutamine methyltransferase [Planctomycetes bacterium]|nr:peptide chain release factor N(5)-glutamine methyltransferase [Planctomycetota bacterium]